MATYKVIGKGQDGKYTDDTARENVISYCMNPYKTKHGYMGSRAVSLKHAAEEMQWLANVYHNDTRVRLRHCVISLGNKEHVSLDSAREIAEYAIDYFGDEYQIIYCIHEDTDQLHVHTVMNQVSYRDGHKYRGTRKQHEAYVRYLKNGLSYFNMNLIYVSSDASC